MVSLSGSMFGVNAGVDANLKTGITGHLSFGSSQVFSRTLTFNTQDLGIDGMLMLTFDKYINGMYDDTFPVCWRMIRFGATGPESTATFESQAAFCKPQVDHASDTIVDAGTYTKLNIGQKTTLVRDDNEVYRFSTPETGQSGTMRALNGTQLKEDLAVGFLRHGEFAPTPMLYFKGVGAGSFIQAKPEPVLRAYVTSQYQETQIIRGEIDTPSIWERDLSTLDVNTVWDVKYDAASRKFSISPA